MTDPDVADSGTTNTHRGLGPRRLGLIAIVGVSAIVLDQMSKHWAVNALADGPISVVWKLQFNLFFNTGVAFSMGTGKGLGPWISLLALAVVVGLSLGATSRTTIGAVASGLIAGGAIGNLIDRAFRGQEGFLHGGVVDFIDFQFWPVFNLADAFVVVGGFLLVLASFRIPEDVTQ
ncbi:MAG: signal peptidase II [Acidimicrobiales bacterium]|nr:signal peptidase II [Acidimicrobiales bacterium]